MQARVNGTALLVEEQLGVLPLDRAQELLHQLPPERDVRALDEPGELASPEPGPVDAQQGRTREVGPG